MSIFSLDPRLQNLKPRKEDDARARLVERVGETMGLALSFIALAASLGAIVFIAHALITGRPS